MNNENNIKLLAIDTSTEHFSVCYYNNGEYSEQNILGDAKSSSYILQMIDEVLAGDSLSALTGIIYTKGPGSFTGVRVGISVVIGLSLAHNIPTLGFSTLEVLEFGATQKYNTSHIISAIDARMGEVYLRVDNKNYLLNPADVTNVLIENYNNYIGVGTGFKTYENFTSCNSIAGEFYPQAHNLIRLALSELNALTFDTPQPLYLRNNVAKKSVKFG